MTWEVREFNYRRPVGILLFDVSVYLPSSQSRTFGHCCLGAGSPNVWAPSHDSAVTRVRKTQVRLARINYTKFAWAITQKTMFCFLLRLCQLTTKAKMTKCSRKLFIPEPIKIVMFIKFANLLTITSLTQVICELVSLKCQWCWLLSR